MHMYTFTGSVRSVRNVLPRKLLSSVKRQRRDVMPRVRWCMRSCWISSHRRRKRKRRREIART